MPLLRAIYALYRAAVPDVAFAQLPTIAISPDSLVPVCKATGICSGVAGGGFGDLEEFLRLEVVPTIYALFIGIGVVYIAWYAVSLIVSGSEESTLSEQKKAFGYAAMGMGIVGAATAIVQTFAPSYVGANIVNPSPFQAAAAAIVSFITIAAGGFLVFVIGISGFRIIALQGNESEIEKQKSNFFHGLLGVPVLLLAKVAVNAIIPNGMAGPGSLVDEILGITRFALEIVSALAVAALMASGLLFVVSMQNDTLKSRARAIFYSTLVILILVIFSYAIVSTFIR